MTALPEPDPSRPAISLIIPAYNEEAYLPACLDAAMAHVADKAIEIIVVDNNSTDGTRDVIERFPGATYAFEGRKGITRARQRGFLASRGTDFHAPGEARVEFDALAPLPSSVTPVWASDAPSACSAALRFLAGKNERSRMG